MKRIQWLGVVLVLALALVACERPAPGTEDAGEQIQETVTNALEVPAEAVDTIVETTENAVDAAGEAVVEGGEAIVEAGENVIEIGTGEGDAAAEGATEGEGSGEAAAPEGGEGEAAAGEGGGEAAAPAPGGEQSYTVQAGDTMGIIAERFGVDINALAARNGIFDVNYVYVGDELIIPDPNAAPPAPPEVTYTVQNGDTLFAIAFSFGKTVEEVAAHNGITDVNALEVGQVIRIP